MTPVFCCGFECGQLGSVGNHWSSSTGFSIDTTIKRNGARSLKTSNVAQNVFISNNITFSATALVARFYIYFDTIPSVDIDLILIRTATLIVASAFFQASDGKIYTRKQSGIDVSVGVSVIAKSWILIDIKGTCSANPWTAEVMVNGISCGQLTDARAANTITLVALNSSGAANQTHDSYFDDILISTTPGDFPLGNGYVNHFIPTSDGTHNVAGTADFQRTLTGTDILNATTTAYQLIDDVPLESGASVDWINMILPPNATDYVECVFGPASGVPTPTYGPRAVETIAGIHQAGTGTGNMAILLRDNATSGTIYSATGVAGTTTVIYKRAHFATPPSGGSWGVASGNGNFNNLRVRFGSPAAVDANPDQYLDCIMIEAEFAEWPQKITQVKQAVNRSNTY